MIDDVIIKWLKEIYDAIKATSGSTIKVWTDYLKTLHDQRLRNDVWTDQKAGFLDANISTAGAKPPIANGLKGAFVSNADLIGTFNPSGRTVSVSVSTYNNWTELLSIPGKGFVEILALIQTANSADRDWAARLYIDGNIAWQSDNDLFKLGAENYEGIPIVGHKDKDGAVMPAAKPFSTSFKVEICKKENASGTVTGRLYYDYYLTGTV